MISLYVFQLIILGFGSGKNMLGHFILVGKCVIAQLMTVEKKGKGWKLCKDQSSTKLSKNMHCICMQACVLTEGACFGIGKVLYLFQQVLAQDRNL